MYGVAGVYFAITDTDDNDNSIWPFTDSAWIVTRLEPFTFDAILKPNKHIQKYPLNLNVALFSRNNEPHP